MIYLNKTPVWLENPRTWEPTIIVDCISEETGLPIAHDVDARDLIADGGEDEICEELTNAATRRPVFYS